MGKKIIIGVSFLTLLWIVSCKNNNKGETQKPVERFAFFGDSIGADNYILANEALSKLADNDSLQLKIRGKVNEVCQKKGCWVTIALNDSTEMRVSFKDYAFFLPKNIANDTVIIEGWMYKDSVSVEELRHYAKDAKKPNEEINKINTPELSYLFEAHGVLLKK